MVDFGSHDAYYEFAEQVLRANRYVIDGVAKDFLDCVRTQVGSRIVDIPQGHVTWRAQVGCEWEESQEDLDGEVVLVERETPFKPARMKPHAAVAMPGRASPRGIPCLYTASSKATAMAEVRPWIGATITCCKFAAVRELTLVSFMRREQTSDDDIVNDEVWRDMERAFARPVGRDDDGLSYVPTQVLAQFLASAGFDGIAYRSSLGDGHHLVEDSNPYSEPKRTSLEAGFNVVYFDVNAAEVVDSALFTTRQMAYDFSPYYPNMYYSNG